MTRIFCLVLLLGFPVLSSAQFQCLIEDVLPENSFPVVVFETDQGVVEVELNRMRAPATVNNFLSYVVEGAYDNTIFHRVIKDFVVQGGGFKAGWEEVPGRQAVMNESGNGLPNDVGTIAMARFSDPHSATNEFFFNVADNRDALDPNSSQWGYTVFGTVISGQEVLNNISIVKTGYDAELDFQDVPITPVRLLKVTVR